MPSWGFHWEWPSSRSRGMTQKEHTVMWGSGCQPSLHGPRVHARGIVPVTRVHTRSTALPKQCFTAGPTGVLGYLPAKHTPTQRVPCTLDGASENLDPWVRRKKHRRPGEFEKTRSTISRFPICFGLGPWGGSVSRRLKKDTSSETNSSKHRCVENTEKIHSPLFFSYLLCLVFSFYILKWDD